VRRDRRRSKGGGGGCSNTDEALRVTPPPLRGDAVGRVREDSTAIAPTTAFRTRNHAASEPSHAASDGHHHSAAIVGPVP